MVTWSYGTESETGVKEYYGLSTDEKPETAGNGSKFMEMDTSTMYMFDAEHRAWLPWT